MANNLDTATLLSIAKNRNKLMRLAEGIKSRKKPGNKKSLNLKRDPAYTNIEHLVFGTYRPRAATPESEQYRNDPSGGGSRRHARNVTSTNSEIIVRDNSRNMSPHRKAARDVVVVESKMSVENEEKQNSPLQPIKIKENVDGKNNSDSQNNHLHWKVSLDSNCDLSTEDWKIDSLVNDSVFTDGIENLEPSICTWNLEGLDNVSGNQTDRSVNCVKVDIVDATGRNCYENGNHYPRQQISVHNRTVPVAENKNETEKFARQNTYPSGIPRPRIHVKHTLTPVAKLPQQEKCPKSTATNNISARRPLNQETKKVVSDKSRSNLVRTSNNNRSSLSADSKLKSSSKSSLSSSHSSLSGNKANTNQIKKIDSNRSSGFVRSQSYCRVTDKPAKSSGVIVQSNQARRGTPRSSNLNKFPAVTKQTDRPLIRKHIDRTSVVQTREIQQNRSTNQTSHPKSIPRPEGTHTERGSRLPFRVTQNDNTECFRRPVRSVSVDSGKVLNSLNLQLSTPEKTTVRKPAFVRSSVSSDVVLKCRSSVKKSTTTVDMGTLSLKNVTPEQIQKPKCDTQQEARIENTEAEDASETVAENVEKSKLLMSDIEEKEENSASTGTSKTTSEEPVEHPPLPRSYFGRNRQSNSLPNSFLLERYGLNGHKVPETKSGESLGLERLLQIGEEPEGSLHENKNVTDLLSETEDIIVNTDMRMGVDLSRENPVSISDDQVFGLVNRLNNTNDVPFETEAVSSHNAEMHRDNESVPSHIPLIRNRPISRSERQLKTTSSPEFRTNSELSSSVRNIYRPWSEVYDEEEAQNVLYNNSSTFNIHKPEENSSHLVLSSTESSSVINSSCSSIRTSSSKFSSADSVLQKFRKSFSLRFQRTRKQDQLDSSNNLPQILSKKEYTESVFGPLARKDLHKLSNESSICDLDNTLLQNPVILRSSKEVKNPRKTNSKCYSADSGIQIEMYSNNEVFNETTQVSVSPTLVRRRAASASESSPKTKPPPRPHSDVGSSLNGNSSIVEAFMAQLSRQRDTVPELKHHLSDSGTPLRKTPSVERQLSTPSFIKMRTDRSRPLKRNRGQSRLRRSISQPLDLEKIGANAKQLGLSDHEGSRDISTASSEDDFSSDGESCNNPHTPLRTQPLFREFSDDGVTYAEALWDHVTIVDAEELAFQAGEVIEVTDSSDKDWWWGSIGARSGWFPAAFVRLRVNQENTVEDCISKMSDGTLMQQTPRKMTVSLLSNEQVRANVVQEIISTERDFVQHLKDVVEGYLRQVRRRSDMFSEDRIATIFGNIQEIYSFQSRFLKHLEACIDNDRPHLSQIGNCFLQHKEEFEIYSEYCNNHPLAVSELQELYADSKYIQFFEACRLLQEMIDISLDGFLLTPVQKICKYPLQLAELLKYTKVDHPDHQPVTKALAAMREVAQLVNERKRRMECLEKLTEWQQSVDGWEGPDLLDTSSMLLHSGEITRASSTWSRDVIQMFLFDHLLVYCKKDMLKRNTYVYKGRIDLDNSCVIDLEDGRDSQFGMTVKNAWKVYCAARDKWFLFYTKTSTEKEQWLHAFEEERTRVNEDKLQGYVVTEEAKKASRLAVINKFKPKRPRAKLPKSTRPHPDTAVAELLLDPPEPKSRTGSLPSNLHPSVAVTENNRHGPPKKKGSGWFHFGSSKKPKKKESPFIHF